MKTVFFALPLNVYDTFFALDVLHFRAKMRVGASINREDKVSDASVRRHGRARNAKVLSTRAVRLHAPTEVGASTTLTSPTFAYAPRDLLAPTVKQLSTHVRLNPASKGNARLPA